MTRLLNQDRISEQILSTIDPNLIRDAAATNSFKPQMILEFNFETQSDFSDPIQVLNHPSPRSGKSALHYACESDSLQSLQFMLSMEKPRSPTQLQLKLKDSSGKTPLDYAKDAPHSKQLVKLIQEFLFPYTSEEDINTKVQELFPHPTPNNGSDLSPNNINNDNTTNDPVISDPLKRRTARLNKSPSIISASSNTSVSSTGSTSTTSSPPPLATNSPSSRESTTQKREPVSEISETPLVIKKFTWQVQKLDFPWSIITCSLDKSVHFLGFIDGQPVRKTLKKPRTSPYEAFHGISINKNKNNRQILSVAHGRTLDYFDITEPKMVHIFSQTLNGTVSQFALQPFDHSFCVRIGAFRSIFYVMNFQTIWNDGIVFDEEVATSFEYLMGGTPTKQKVAVGHKNGSISLYLFSVISAFKVAHKILYSIKANSKITPRFLKTIGHKGPINCIVGSPSGEQFATGGSDCEMKLFDTLSGNFICSYTGNTHPITCIVWAKSSKVVFLISGNSGGVIKVYDTRENSYSYLDLGLPENQKLPGITKLAISKDTRFLTSGHIDNSIRIWDLWYSIDARKNTPHNSLITTGMIHTLKTHTKTLTGLLFGPPHLAAKLKKIPVVEDSAPTIDNNVKT